MRFGTACVLILAAMLTPDAALAADPSNAANYLQKREEYRRLARARYEECRRLYLALPRMPPPPRDGLTREGRESDATARSASARAWPCPPLTSHPRNFEEPVGLDGLTLYQWGHKEVNHYFCKTCGVYPFHDGPAKPGHYRVNLGCIDGLDPLALEIGLIDGRSF